MRRRKFSSSKKERESADSKNSRNTVNLKTNTKIGNYNLKKNKNMPRTSSKNIKTRSAIILRLSSTMRKELKDSKKKK